MKAGTQMQRSETQPEGGSSPDWVKSEYGQMQPTKRQAVRSDNFVELKYRSLDNIATAKFAKGLGLFSIALGLAEILAPGHVGEAAGLSSRFKRYLPLLGAREIAHGLAILASPKPTAAVWTRVGGDAIDLAYLGAAFAADDTNKRRLTGATLAVLGAGALDLLCAQKLSARSWSENDGNPMAPTTVGQSSAR